MPLMAGRLCRIIRHSAGFAEQRSKISRIPGRAGRFGRRSAIKPYLCWAAIRGSLAQSQCSLGTTMKRLVLASAIFLTFAPAVALAEGRGGDAALGALSGAVVFGPVGLVAGAVVGYTAGPSIAHSWGFRRSGSKKPSREKSQAGMSPSRVSQNTPAAAASPEQTATTTTSAPAKPASATAQRWATPPVQGLE